MRLLMCLKKLRKNNMHKGFYSDSMHDEMEDYIGRYDRLYFMEKMMGGELEEESLKIINLS